MKPHLSGLSSLQLPGEALERIWKRTGHLVPSELDGLISFLRETRDSYRARSVDLRKEYESYVQLCKSVNITPDDPLASGKPGEILWDFESANSPGLEEKVKEIPLRFARFDQLRAVEQSLRDLDILARVLTKVRDRFSKLPSHKGGEVRLFIYAKGTDIALQLVYEAKGNGSLKVEKRPEGKLSKAGQSGNADVREWINFGLRALARKNMEQPAGELNFGWDLPPTVELVWDNTLDTILGILQNEKLARK